jgi:nitrogen-specific signal transduction histidine kinase/CheY-like chemotaxis protein
VKGGGVSSFSVSICSFQKEAQRYFMFQLLPDWSFAADSKGQATDFTLAQKHKLDVALQLARTVSLDFNNSLTSILGYTSLMLSQMEPTNPWRHLLVEVEKSASKAAETANDLGTFSRQEKEARTQASGNLNSIVQRSTEILRASSKKEISWSMQLERKLFTTKFDEAKLQQAFVKVLENANEGIEARGRITVQSRNVELSQGTQDRDLRLAPGTYVCVEISDSGSGIATDVLPRIFEPFFTTKKAAGHRGLGLALVYGIVTNHGGGVAVSSQPGVGTSVRIYLPAEKRLAQDSGPSDQDLNGTETILMVDDEDLLLTMGKTILGAYGYKVLTANSGQKALDIFAKQEPKVDLIITDMVMPAMSGRELAEHIRRQSPETPILCTSGFVRPSNQSDDVSYLQKPFTSQELLAKVKTVLAGNIS